MRGEEWNFNMYLNAILPSNGLIEIRTESEQALLPRIFRKGEMMVDDRRWPRAVWSLEESELSEIGTALGREPIFI